MVGVQTNQFPRAVDLAQELKQLGIQVCIGGFHVSGCIAMLKEVPTDIQRAMDDGISMYAGELEGRLDQLLADAQARELKPLYDTMSELPELGGRPVPYLPADLIHRMSGSRTSFDAGRGCPFSCSFCTIINVQGRKSRFRTADDIEKVVRDNVAQGIYKFFVTDDNFARNEAWESLFDRLAQLRAEGLVFWVTIQVDTLCHKIPRFIEKAGRAGVDRVFIGLENINPDSLKSSRKHQNNITEYRAMLQEWHSISALTMAGYILGFPDDTPETIQRDIGIIQRELPIDLLYFFILTPLPGSQDHKELHEAGVPMEADMNSYDSVHVTAPHARMTAQEWVDVYQKAWDCYYTFEHAERIMRRARSWGFPTNKIKWMMLSFYGAAKVERVHPMDSGIFRRKHRRDRRSGRPIENPITFYPRFWWQTARKLTGFLHLYFRLHAVYRRVEKRDLLPDATDVAMKPIEARDLDDLEMFTVSDAAVSVARKTKKKAERVQSGGS